MGSKYAQIRTKNQLNFLKFAKNGDKIKLFLTRRYIPSFYYSLKLSFILHKYNVNIYLPDFHFNLRFPSKKSLNKLRGHGSKVIAHWHETFDIFSAKKRIIPVLEQVSMHLFLDDPELELKKYVDFNSNSVEFFPWPTFPLDFYFPFKPRLRKIDACFFGAVENSAERSDRNLFLNYLKNHNFNVVGFFSKDTAEKVRRPDYGSMLEILRVSKIGLNFSSHGGKGIVTSRVIETIASGAVLFSQPSQALNRILIPNYDYITFNSPSHLLFLLNENIRDLNKLRTISIRAQKKILNYCTENLINKLTN